MPAIYHEGSWLGNATDPEVLVKDTVGWTGKNLLKNTATTQTINGVTFTVNADKSVTANGTATAAIDLVVCYDLPSLYGGRYILSGCPSGGAVNKYRITAYRIDSIDGQSGSLFDIGNGLEFTYKNTTGNARFIIYIENGVTVNNLTFYPMIRKADIIDPTYEPYHESVEEEIEQIYADNGVLGAKNLLQNTATSQTINGVTVTVDDNKVITLNGTSTADSYITIFATSDLNSVLAKYGDLILNGSHPTEYTKARMITRYGTSNYVVDSGKGVLLSSAIAYEIGITLQIFKNNTFTNHKVYPMLRLASDPDDTYQPYAMTNRELTEKKINIADLKTVVSASSDFTDFKTRIASL